MGKIKRCTAILLIIGIVCCLFSGCTEKLTVTVSDNGVVDYAVKVYMTYSEALLLSAKEGVDLTNLKTENIDGVDYYVYSASKTFSSPRDFNDATVNRDAYSGALFQYGKLTATDLWGYINVSSLDYSDEFPVNLDNKYDVSFTFSRKITATNGEKVDDYTVKYNEKTLTANKVIFIITESSNAEWTKSDNIAESIKSLAFVQRKPSADAKVLSDKKVRIRWTNCSGASGYQVFKKKSYGGSWKHIAATGATVRKYTDSYESDGSNYFYKVRAFRNDAGKKVFSKYSYVYGITSFNKNAAGALKKIKIYKCAIGILPRTLKNASGYEIYLSKSPDSGFKMIKSMKEYNYRGRKKVYIKHNLQAKTEYYLKTRAFIKIKGKKYYSKFSPVKKAVTK